MPLFEQTIGSYQREKNPIGLDHPVRHIRNLWAKKIPGAKETLNAHCASRKTTAREPVKIMAR